MQASTASNVLISVVICTYNREALLAEALRSVCNQTIDKRHYEVLVVDNNSQDDTCEVVRQYAEDYPNVKYHSALIQGLSHARNCGWQNARGTYIAYMDDDCKVPPEWLAVAQKIIAEIGPGAFGGPIRPFFNIEKPKWISQNFGAHQPFDEPRLLQTAHECTRIFGGNAFFRRTLLKALGGFDPKLGMSGEKVSYGEESALLKTMHTAMPDQPIYFDPALYVYHLVKPVTMTWRYNILASFEAGQVSFSQNRSKFASQKTFAFFLQQVTRTLLVLAYDLLRSIFSRDCNQYPYIQTYLYEHSLQYVRKLGLLYAQIKDNNKRDKSFSDEMRNNSLPNTK